MNRLKPWFISGYVSLALALTVYSLLEVIRRVPPTGLWAGVLLAAGAPALFFIWLFVAKPSSTPRHPMAVTLLSGLGVAVSMAISWRYPGLAGKAFGWAAAAFIGWFIYLRWYSVFPDRGRSSLKVGTLLPDFSFYSLDGQSIDSASLRGQPHILIFYRGNWCPLCMAQVRDIAAAYRELSDRGARIMLVSPQPAGHSQKLAHRFAAPLEFFEDRHNQAARTLGIDSKSGIPAGMQLLGYASDTTMPTVVISDTDGRVLFADLTDNYRVRPEPDTYLQVLDKAIPGSD